MFDRLNKIKEIRKKLSLDNPSIGSWIQIPAPSVAEVMGQSGYDWVAVDMEHGAISIHQLPDLFRALELGGTLPLARIAEGQVKDCKQVLDAGAGGVIVPMIETAEQLREIKDACCWPPVGSRGVGFSRANLFGKYFDSYVEEAQTPMLIAMIEHINAVDKLDEILQVDGLDAIMIGPYDLSASMGITAQFENAEFMNMIECIKLICNKNKIACGMHVVMPDSDRFQDAVDSGYQWIAYSIDAAFLYASATAPKVV